MLGRKVTGSVEKNYSDKTEDGVTPVTTLLHFPVSDVVTYGYLVTGEQVPYRSSSGVIHE